MSRYWDGRVRRVVKLVKVLKQNLHGVPGRKVRVELLDCGHTKHSVAIGGPQDREQARVCDECPGMKEANR